MGSKFWSILCFLAAGICAIPAMAVPNTIDSSKSYLEVDVLSWEGSPWSFSTPGFPDSAGYYWQPTVRAERFSLSGNFNLTQYSTGWDLSGVGIRLSEVELFSSVLDVMGFTLPTNLAFNPETGDISKDGPLGCPTGAYCLIFTQPDFSHVAGSLIGDVLTLDGSNNNTGLSSPYYVAYFGGVEPPLGGIQTSSSVRYHLVATAVPEADTWTMLLAGLGLVGAATRRRRG